MSSENQRAARITPENTGTRRAERRAAGERMSGDAYMIHVPLWLLLPQ